MLQLMLAVNPTLAMWGQIAAIIICLFIFVYVLIFVAFNLIMAFGLAWIREKANVVKMLRPTVDSVNKTSEAASKGIAPSDNENAIVRSIASVPMGVHQMNDKVEQTSERVARAVIEFRARTVQAQTVVKAFLLPGLMKRQPVVSAADGELDFKSPGYRILMEKQAEEVPVEAPIGDRVEAATGDGYAQTITASQLKNARSR
ncbi:MAG: hypothetical protein JOZ18_06550 [Chloroflexi bacterium]|nr:hypothetical protein [Chloroflexota bacterium]